MTSDAWWRIVFRLLSYLWRPYLFGGAIGLGFLITQAAFGFPVPWLSGLALILCVSILARVWRTSLTVEEHRLRICNGGRTFSVAPDEVESISVGPTWRSPGELPTVYVNRRSAPPLEVEAARLASSSVRRDVAEELIQWCKANHVPCSLPREPGLFWGGFKRTA